MPFLNDILKNEAGKYSPNMLMRAITFALGCCFATTSLVGSFFGKDVRLDAAVLSWSLSYGVAGLRVGEAWLNRKTADGNNNPLAVPGTVDPPAAEPILMPTTPKMADQEAAAAEAI